MKKKLALTLFAFALVFGGKLFAQTAESPLSPFVENIKVLPTEKQGIIKVLYAMESESPVEIKFYTNDGEIGSDQVTRDRYEKGFLKWYDISHITTSDFRVEVSTENARVMYRIARSKDKKTFEPILEKVSYNEVITASKKGSGKN
jgi:hypothetical protein